MNKNIKILELPDLPIIYFLSLLPLADLLTTRVVCKRFHGLATRMMINRTVTMHVYLEQDQVPGDKIIQSELFQHAKLQILLSDMTCDEQFKLKWLKDHRHKITGLKILYLDDVDESLEELEWNFDFPVLDKLELGFCSFANPSIDVLLSKCCLTLKTLIINEVSVISLTNIRFDLPNLSYIKINSYIFDIKEGLNWLISKCSKSLQSLVIEDSAFHGRYQHKKGIFPDLDEAYDKGLVSYC